MSERDNQYIKIVSQGSASGQPTPEPPSDANANRRKLARTNSYNGEHLRQENERQKRRNLHHSGSPHNAQDMKGPQLQPIDHQRQYTFNNSNAMYQNQRFGSSSDSRGRSEAVNPRCESRAFGSSQYTRTFSKTVNEIEDTIYRDYHKQSAENISPNMVQAEDPDVEFVQFLKSIQLYVQQPTSPKSKKGDYYYENLQFLREKYKQFKAEKMRKVQILDQHTQPPSRHDTFRPKQYMVKQADKSTIESLTRPIDYKLAQMPEKQRDQIEFINEVYKKVVLNKSTTRVVQKRKDRELQEMAQKKLNDIQRQYPKRQDSPVLVDHWMCPDDLQTYSCDRSTSQNNSKSEQCSGYFVEPPPQQEAPPKMNRDLMSIVSTLKTDTKSQSSDCVPVPRAPLQPIKMKKSAGHEPCETYGQSQQALPQTHHADNSMLNHFNQLNDSSMSNVHPQDQMGQTIQSYDGHIIAQNAAGSRQGTISDSGVEQIDLLTQVQMLQKHIGDPKSLTVNQLGETLAALNQTAFELKNACQGIAEYANVLNQAQMDLVRRDQQMQLALIEEQEQEQTPPDDAIRVTFAKKNETTIQEVEAAAEQRSAQVSEHVTTGGSQESMKGAPQHHHFHINSYSDIENDINIFTNKANQNISQTSYFQTDMNESMH